VGLPLAAQNGTEQPLTITISALTPSVKAGLDVWVVVKITNHLTERLDESESIIGETSLDPNLVFDVRDTSGNLIARKLFEHPERVTGHNVNRSIESGATLTQQQNISRFYDLIEPGSDVVQVSRSLSRGPRSGVVKSNKLAIDVKAPTLKSRESSKAGPPNLDYCNRLDSRRAVGVIASDKEAKLVVPRRRSRTPLVWRTCCCRESVRRRLRSAR